ncbi:MULTISPECIES: hypothetical protein [unclassified Frankia]|uniref:hypothetical protein n=1 Tax=unclassified Frankia TaxID=2632575 RepID=UPI001EF50D43|nr:MULTISPECIES: hypothetical protein [unclassified Frankia]
MPLEPLSVTHPLPKHHDDHINAARATGADHQNLIKDTFDQETLSGAPYGKVVYSNKFFTHRGRLIAWMTDTHEASPARRPQASHLYREVSIP